MSDGRIKLIRLDKNQGASAARNAGVRASSGQWLAWLDSDDVWCRKKKLSMQMSFLDGLGAARETTALTTGFELCHPGGKLDKRLPIASSSPLHFFAGCWFHPGSTVLHHRSLFDRIGPFDETMQRLEDVDWFIRLAMAGGRLDTLPQIMTTINVGQKASYGKVKRSGNRVLAKYKNSSLDVTKSAMDNLASYLHLEYAASAIKRERRFIKGAYHLATSFLIRPRSQLQLYRFWNVPE